MASQSTHTNIQGAVITHISCVPYLDGALLMVSTDGVGTTLQIDGQQFESIRTCLNLFAEFGRAQHLHARRESEMVMNTEHELTVAAA